MKNLLLSWWNEHGNLRTLYLLLLGQVASFVVALLSFTSSLIAAQGVDAPLSQSFFTYLSLGLVYGSILIYRRQRLLMMESISLSVIVLSVFVSWYWYLLLGFLDIQGNYLANKAYQFTSLTSVTLLDCCTIAWAILLTWIFLGTRYSLWQIFGAATCVVGLGLIFLSDAGAGGGGGSKPLLGDSIVIVATILFAISNVAQEFLVKKKDRVEFLCMLGVYGGLVTLWEIPFIELKSLESITWTKDIILAIVGFVLSGFIFYSITPFILKTSGATMFNLSILTSDMWAVIFRIFFYGQQVDWHYYVSFVVVVIGLIIYSLTEKSSTPSLDHDIDANDHDIDAQYKTLPNGNDA